MNRRSNNGLLPWWQVVLLDILAIGICPLHFFFISSRSAEGRRRFQTEHCKRGSRLRQRSGTTSVSTPLLPKPPVADSAQEPGQTSAPVGDFSAAFEAAGDITGEYDYTSDDNIRIAVDKITGETPTATPLPISWRISGSATFSISRQPLPTIPTGRAIKRSIWIWLKAITLSPYPGDFYGARSSGIVIRNGELYPGHACLKTSACFSPTARWRP